MDFAYRYTSSVLADALHIQNEGYDVPADAPGGAAAAGPSGTGRGRGAAAGAGRGQGKNAAGGSGGGAGGGEDGEINLSSLRLAIGSRIGYQFTAGNMPKDFVKGLAEERNRIGLNVGGREVAEKGGATGANAAAGSVAAGVGGTTMAGVKLPHERYCLTGVGWGMKDEWDSEGEEDVEDGDGGDEMNVHGTAAGANDDDAEIEMGEDEDGEGNMEDVFGADEATGQRDEGDEEMEGT